MKSFVASLLLVFIVGRLEVQGQPPRASAVFSNSVQGPAFMLDCPNTTAASLNLRDLGVAFKLDGREFGDGPGGGSVGGQRAMLEPAQSWKILLVLTQNPSATQISDLGERLRIAYAQPVQIGLHRISFRCAGSWSDEIEFYWNSTTVP